MSATTEVSPWAAQRAAALARANWVRSERTRLLGGANDPKVLSPGSMAGILLDPPDVLASMRISELLARTQQYRSARVRDLLRAVGIGESRSLRDLTERQRVALAERLVGGKR